MGSSSSKGLQKTIDEEVQEYPVVVFTKTSCGYSKKAKSLLEGENIHFRERDLTQIQELCPNEYEAYLDGLTSKTNKKTVPQIFVCGKFIGGYDDLERLKKEDRLKKLVEPCQDKFERYPKNGAATPCKFAKMAEMKNGDSN